MVESTWRTRALPIMEAIAKAEESDHRPDASELATARGLSKAACVRELRSLVNDGYVEAIEMNDMDGDDWMAARLTPRGRRAVGEWPGDPVEALLATLDRMVSETADPDKRGRLQRLRSAAADVGKGALGSALVAAAEIAAHGGAS